MIFRRKAKNDDTEATGPAGSDDVVEAPVEEEGAEEAGTPEGRSAGPFDSSEVDASELEAEDRIDLGALVITGMPGMELRLQVDGQGLLMVQPHSRRRRDARPC